MESKTANFSGLIAVHLGAGYHAPKTLKETLGAAKAACSKLSGFFKVINAKASCTEAIALLEDNPFTNAGIGSNLTLHEAVECDASLMNGETLSFGAVGSLSGIRNPIRVAEAILRLQEEGHTEQTLLLPPMILVGNGAKQFAQENGLETMPPDAMVTSRSLEDFRKSLKRVSSSIDREQNILARLDTIGAIAINHLGHIAAGCSSGGILLKHPGRLGHAVVFGAGCWAQESAEFSVAASTSGCGENIIRTQLARSCCEAVLEAPEDECRPLPQLIQSIFLKKFVENSGMLISQNKSHRLAGILLVKFCRETKKAEVVWCHNTPSMCVGFSSRDGIKPKALLTELENESLVAVHGCCI